MADDRPPWTLLVWLGLIAGAALGGLVMLALRDRRGGLGGLGAPIQIYNGYGPHGYGAPGGGGFMLPSAEPASYQSASPARQSRESRMRTLNISSQSPTRIFHASGDNPWTVHVTIQGPPGSVAYLSTEPDSLAEPGNNAMVTAGGSAPVRLQPGQSLFAIASNPKATASIIATDDALPPSLFSYYN